MLKKKGKTVLINYLKQQYFTKLTLIAVQSDPEF